MIWLSLVLLIVVAVTWALVLLLKLPLWIAIVVTAIAVLALVAVFAARAIRARLRAAALERELLRQAEQQAERVRPDRRAEILALQAQMKSALESLKRTKLGSRNGKAALYALPWYVIVGPPAAGKTTALTQSALGFIAPPGSSSSKVRGTAGTRNCDWWFSQHAILLDTAGRLSTGEDDRDEWLTFLDTVRRFRPERPLEGLVVALSIEDLLSKNEVEREEMAKTLRARAEEVMSRLELVLPIYVMFTKVDLVAGFVEYWGDLTKAQRAQPWGASFALDESLDEPAPVIEAEFDLLLRVLHARMVERLTAESVAEVRARILAFPLEFSALRRPLVQFLEELARPNPYQETPLLRGFYFTSGTQTGHSIDRVLDNMARGFNLPLAPTPRAGAAAAPQSYFVTDLFQSVIFPDRHVAVRSRSRTRKAIHRQAILAGVAVLLMLAILLPAATSYVENEKLVRGTARDLEQSAELERAPNGGAAATAGALDLLVSRVQMLEQKAAESHIWGLYGPYAAPKLYDSLKRVYLERLRALVSGPVQAQLVSDVRAIGDLVDMDATNFHEAYDNLKLYLMMCQRGPLAPDFATERLTQSWARALRSDSANGADKLAAHAHYYIAALATDPTFAFKADNEVIARAQGRLAGLDAAQLHYGWLEQSARGLRPIRPEDIFYGASGPYWIARPNVQVRGLYTALGWQKVRAILDSKDTRFDLEPWVLGKNSAPEEDSTAAANVERVRSLYFQRYAQAWTDFIGGLEVQPPSDLNGALAELRVLSETDGPYDRLFRVLAENVRLDLGPTSLLERAEGKAKELASSAVSQLTGADAGAPERQISPVERQFQPMLRFAYGENSASPTAAPSGLKLYLMQLANLAIFLGQLAEQRAEPTDTLDAELSRTAASVQHLLDGVDRQTRSVLEPLLMSPIRGGRTSVARADYSALSDHWKTEVFDVYNEKLANHFPFAEVPAEVSLPDFADFFRPQTGALWKFYAQNLDARLERSGNKFVPRPSADPIPFREDFLRCLNVAQEITDAVFGTGTEPLVSFSVQMHEAGADIAQISLIIDGQALVYQNEPERWMPAQWPGKGTPHGGTLRVTGAAFNEEILRVGDFGLFRLLAAGTLKAGGVAEGMPMLSYSWTLSRAGEPPVNIDVKPSKSVHPFARDFFRRFKCPPETTPGGGAAAGSASAGGGR